MKKIINKACAVIITLNSWWLPCKYCTPGDDSSIRIITLNAVPSIPLNTAKIRYNVPISLAFVLNNHRVMLNEIICFSDRQLVLKQYSVKYYYVLLRNHFITVQLRLYVNYESAKTKLRYHL